jgi:hypothetical protein
MASRQNHDHGVIATVAAPQVKDEDSDSARLAAEPKRCLFADE